MPGIGMYLVAIRLPRLGEQNQRCGLRRLKTKCEIQKNKWIYVELRQTHYVHADPDRDNHRLPNQERWCPKEAREAFSFQCKPVVTKHRVEMDIRLVKAVVMVSVGPGLGHRGGLVLDVVHDGRQVDEGLLRSLWQPRFGSWLRRLGPSSGVSGMESGDQFNQNMRVRERSAPQMACQ